MNQKEKLMKGVFFITLGCRLNQAETNMLKNNALERGFRIAQSESTADIFIINSCSVTDKAQRETNKLLKNLTAKYPEKKAVITGCGAHDEHKKYAFVVSNEDKNRLFSLLSQQSTKRCLKPFSRHSEQSEESQRSFVVPPQDDEICGRTRLMVKVQEGCNNFCAYCIVPYLRGREYSYEPERIISDLKKAEEDGYNEIVLCGVNVGKYEYHDVKLAGLIQEILVRTEIPRIRLSSINPDDFSDDLIDLWVKNDRLCPHFHISLQSGSNSVLKRMGRRYNTKQYAELVAKIRKRVPDVQITTDVIVGFPGETEGEFAETVAFVKKIKFLKVHVFRYSPREGTRAADMDGQISEKIKKERAVKLQKIESDVRQRTLLNYISKEVEVLFEQEKNGYYSGFTKNYIKVLKASKKDLTNQITKVTIKALDENLVV